MPATNAQYARSAIGLGLYAVYTRDLRPMSTPALTERASVRQASTCVFSLADIQENRGPVSNVRRSHNAGSGGDRCDDDLAGREAGT